MLHAERITDTGHPLYEAALALYAESFPLHERREPHSQTAILRNDAYHFDVFTDGADLVGEILSWDMGDFLYVEHFCIAPSVRNRGYGSAVLRSLGGRAVILEIDPETDETAKRRRGFYERCGFVGNPYRHIHPPYHAHNAGHLLTVMSFPRALSPAEYGNFRAYLENTVMKNAF